MVFIEEAVLKKTPKNKTLCAADGTLLHRSKDWPTTLEVSFWGIVN